MPKKPTKKAVAEVAGRLLAAEAEYLDVWGWVPLVRENPGRLSDVFWSRDGITLLQSKAVQLQKLEHDGMT